MIKTKSTKKPSISERILYGIERAGNKLPDPTTLFIILAVLVVVISGICGAAGVSAVHPGTGKTITVTNLFSVDGIRRMWSSAVTNFSSFAPFGMVMVAVIGAGAAEKTGFLTALMHKMLSGVPRVLVTFIIILIGINGNIAGDAAFVVMPPLAAIIFLGMGRHPLLGMFAAFASVAAGFCANLMIGLSDVLAFSFTLPAAQLIDPNYEASATINYYFLLASCVLLSIVGTFVTEKVMAPRFENADLSKYSIDESLKCDLTEKQNKGLKASGIAFLITVAVIVLMSIGSNPILGDETGSIMGAKAPFMNGIIVTVTLLMLVPAAAYGFGSGQLKNDKDLWAVINDAFRDMAPYILLCFFIAQFASYFSWSNLGAVLAIKGANLLTSLHFTGIPLLIGLIFISCIINLFIGSASAKWAILAPVFVPMLMLMGYNPAVTQIAYRIGDSITNPLSPLFSYFPLILGFVHKYEPKAGLGTIIANMVPYSAYFSIVWILQLVVWVLLDLPLGPGGPINYIPY